MLTDNGAVFTGRYRGDGRVALEVTLDRLGIRFTHSRPYHPQTCGKVERFHQTHKKWLAAQPTARHHLASLQRQLDTFRRYYNTVRPHRALGRRTPSAGLHRPTQSHPHRHRPRHAHWRIRHDTIDRSACSPCATTAACTTSASAAATPAPTVLILIKDRTSGSPQPTANYSANFVLDPSRDYQPQPKT